MKKIILALILYLLTSVNSEAQWYVQYQSTGVIYDVRFINQNTGWACGGGMILKTTNSGNNWTLQNFNATFNQIHPVNDSVIFACGFYVIYKSTNGGDSWIVIKEGTNQAPILYGLWFINENTGWFCGDRAVMRTTNGGQTFIDSMFMTNTCNDIHFKNSTTGNIAANSTMFRTTNSGVNWYPVNLPIIIATPFVEKISFYGDTGWTVTGGAWVFNTTNYGISWDTISHIPVKISETMNSIDFADSKTGYAGGYNGKIYKSTNGGFDWKVSLNIGIGSFVSIYSINPYIIWATGGSGKIVNTTNGGLTYINNPELKKSRHYHLFQNYPNPFNPKTIIKYQIFKDTKVKIIIYNIMGEKLITLIDKKQSEGIHSVEFDGSDLSSGIYFYKLLSEEYSETKTMNLIK